MTEAEVALAARALLAVGIEPAEERRRGRDVLPLVIAGGPLTFADGTPLAAIADVVLCGEGEDQLEALLGLAAQGLRRVELLEHAALLSGALVPAMAEPKLVDLAVADQSWLPAYSAVLSPVAEFGNMFLIEAARGCPRQCAFCVMEASQFRSIPADAVFERVPPEVKRVGIVGAALLDHPDIAALVARLVQEDHQVSLSSLRADRLDSELLAWLVRGGLRSLTIAADGASERLRSSIRKRVTEEDLLRAARLAAEAGLSSIKLYAMIGLPGEEEEDLEELCRLAGEMSRLLPLTLAVSPFVPKARTSLAGADFAAVPLLRQRLVFLRDRLRGQVELRSSSVRGAWIEQAVARGGLRAGEAAIAAARRGCAFDAWRDALQEYGLAAFRPVKKSRR